MTKKTKRFRAIISFLVLFLIIIFFIIPSEEEKLIDKGNEIIKKIELYKKQADSLPINLKEIGFDYDDLGPLYYTKIDSVYYQLWYGTSLGESVTYDSKQKKWVDY